MGALQNNTPDNFVLRLKHYGEIILQLDFHELTEHAKCELSPNGIYTLKQIILNLPDIKIYNTVKYTLYKTSALILAQFINLKNECGSKKIFKFEFVNDTDLKVYLENGLLILHIYFEKPD